MQPHPIRVLSGDIGGTKTRLAVIVVNGNKLRTEQEQSYPSRDYAEFGDLLGEFLRNADVPDRAAFGIAGPVLGGVAQTTNLPWRIDASDLRIEFGLRSCALLNDLEATAWGIPALGEEDLLTLHPGVPDAWGNQAVIAAGTGLGEAGLYWDGLQYRPFATEGGHASFSPSDDLEMALLKHLMRVHRHVSWERVISGPGLVSLHEFHCLYPPYSRARMAPAGDAARGCSGSDRQRGVNQARRNMCKDIGLVRAPIWCRVWQSCAESDEPGRFVSGRRDRAKDLATAAKWSLPGSIFQQGTDAPVAGSNAGKSDSERPCRPVWTRFARLQERI